MKIIRGGDGEWQAATICNRGYAGSNPTPASNFAVLTEASTPVRTFNHTAEAMGSKQPRLYASRCVSQKGAQSWTNNKNENNADW